MTENPEPERGEPDVAPPTTPPPQLPNHIRRSRTSSAWISLVVAAIVGIVLLIFILQNLDKARVHLLFWWFSMPIGVGALLAAIGGALIMALAGGLRILQLRRATKKVIKAAT